MDQPTGQEKRLLKRALKMLHHDLNLEAEVISKTPWRGRPRTDTERLEARLEQLEADKAVLLRLLRQLDDADAPYTSSALRRT